MPLDHRPAGPRRRLAAAAALAVLPSAGARAQGGAASAAPPPMDPARAAALYVSNRPADHPQADFARQSAAKARTDSIYAARSRGAMAFSRVSSASGVDSLRVPLLVHLATYDEDVNFEEARPLVDALRARKPDLAETKVYVDPTPGPVSVGHTFSRRVNRQTLEREDSPEQRDSWNRVWTFFELWLRPYEAAPAAAAAR
jgi:dienelactone hydrolase